jgi:O-acetylhomoserine (thiol)-lyase
MNKLKIVKRATNLNDNKSLIIHPASTICAEYSKEIIQKMEVRDTMMRFSIGIEDAEDIVDDLKQALE